jgi:hypothetical protein
VQVVTQPAVERVIERKEEKIIEQGSKLVQGVIEKGTPSIVVFGTKRDEGTSNIVTDNEDVFVKRGVGVVIGSTGKILTLASSIDEKLSYYVLSTSGTSTQIATLLPLSLEKKDSSANLARLGVSSPKAPTFTPLPISKKTLSIGQTVVVWGSQGVSVSFISSSQEGKAGTVYRIYTDSTDPLPGRIVSDIEGELIGILRSDGTLIPTTVIAPFLVAETPAAGA